MKDIVNKYHHERHFLQVLHLSQKGTSMRPFVYVKNHKGACSTVLATILRHQMKFLNLPVGPISNANIHNPPKFLMRNGKRNLNVADAISVLGNQQVYKFTIVRDPVARILSAFSDKILRQTKQRAAFFKHIGRPMDSELKISEFIDIVTTDSVARDLDRHWRPQCNEISYGLIQYDYIGTVNNIDIALRHVMGELFNLHDLHIEDTRKTIGHKTASATLRSGLTKTELGKLEKAYAKDFEMYAAVTETSAYG